MKPSQRVGGVGRPSCRAGRDRETLQEGSEGLAGPPKEPGGVKKPFWKAGRGREALLKSRRGGEALTVDWEGSGGPSGWLGGLESLPKGPGGDGKPYGGQEGS